MLKISLRFVFIAKVSDFGNANWISGSEHCRKPFREIGIDIWIVEFQYRFYLPRYWIRFQKLGPAFCRVYTRQCLKMQHIAGNCINWLHTYSYTPIHICWFNPDILAQGITYNQRKPTSYCRSNKHSSAGPLTYWDPWLPRGNIWTAFAESVSRSERKCKLCVSQHKFSATKFEGLWTLQISWFLHSWSQWAIKVGNGTSGAVINIEPCSSSELNDVK